MFIGPDSGTYSAAQQSEDIDNSSDDQVDIDGKLSLGFCHINA